jgi:hypothetical protein
MILTIGLSISGSPPLGSSLIRRDSADGLAICAIIPASLAFIPFDSQMPLG